MRTMWSCISDPRNFRAHLETHRQMQPLQVCTVSNRKLEDADENAQWGKAKPMQPMRLYVYSDPSTLRTHLKRCSGERSNTCNQCDFASSRAGDLRRHLKTHSGEKSSKCNQLRQGPSVTWKKASRLGNLTMWLCLFSCRQFEDTFENAQWRKVK